MRAGRIAWAAGGAAVVIAGALALSAVWPQDTSDAPPMPAVTLPARPTVGDSSPHPSASGTATTSTAPTPTHTGDGPRVGQTEGGLGTPKRVQNPGPRAGQP